MKKLILLALFTIITVVFAHEQETFQMPKITKHHKIFAEGAGEWKLEQKMWYGSGKEPIIAIGTSFSKVILNGLALLVHVETKSASGTFKGFGVFTWNIIEKKYECTWVDVYSYYGLDSMEGTYDEKTHSMTWTGIMKDPKGNSFPMTMVENCPNKDTVITEFYVTVNGQKMKTMVNTYTRIKSEEVIETTKTITKDTEATISVEVEKLIVVEEEKEKKE